LLTILHHRKKKKDFKFASIETKQTDSFSVMIERELEKIKEKSLLKMKNNRRCTTSNEETG
jgi:hypothetical protein